MKGPVLREHNFMYELAMFKRVLRKLSCELKNNLHKVSGSKWKICIILSLGEAVCDSARILTNDTVDVL